MTMQLTFHLLIAAFRSNAPAWQVLATLLWFECYTQSPTTTVQMVSHQVLLLVLCSIQEQRSSVAVLLAGTSGTGKSTLAGLLAARLGITTVLSTDNIRHMLRSFAAEDQNPLLWASTYQVRTPPPPWVWFCSGSVVNGYDGCCHGNYSPYAHPRHDRFAVQVLRHECSCAARSEHLLGMGRSPGFVSSC